MKGWACDAVVAVALTVACTTILGSGCDDAGSSGITIVPAEMRLSGRHTQGQIGDVALWSNGALRCDVDVANGLLEITIFARGTNLAGEWPQVHIELGSRIVASLTIDSQQTQSYKVKVQAPHTGVNVLNLALVNHLAVPDKPLAGRNLVVEKVVIRQS